MVNFAWRKTVRNPFSMAFNHQCSMGNQFQKLPFTTRETAICTDFQASNPKVTVFHPYLGFLRFVTATILSQSQMVFG
jgi:hypothetical protein